jgi:hypothetical protein
MKSILITIILFLSVSSLAVSQTTTPSPPKGQETTREQANANTASGQTAAGLAAERQLPFVQAYGWCVLGIILSVLLPILRTKLPKATEDATGGAASTQPTFMQRLSRFFSAIWPRVKPYIIVGLFSLLTGILVVAFVGTNIKSWEVAVLTGYAWDSTLQKLRGTQ